MKNIHAGYVSLIIVFAILLMGSSTGSWEHTTTDSLASTSFMGEVGAYEPHHVIEISNNNDFSQQAAENNWTGSGTKNSPYIISGYKIDGSGYGYGILIENTTVYFKIEDNNISNTTSSSNSTSVDSGIILLNVQNGVIENNICEKNANAGIYISNSPSVIIRNNTCSNNIFGLLIASSNDAEVYNNTAYSNDYNGVLLMNSNYVRFYFNTVYDNQIGIEMRNLVGDNIAGNNIYSNFQNNTYLFNVTNNIFQDNELSQSRFGMFFQASKNNNVTGNTIYKNSIYGVYLDTNSSGNTIYNNSFYFNHGSGSTYNSSHVQAYDNGTGNYWYSPSKDRGNYWYDWANNNNTNDLNNNGIVDWPYLINGDSGAEDKYPLKNSDVIVPEFEPALPVLILILTSLLIIKRKRLF